MTQKGWELEWRGSMRVVWWPPSLSVFLSLIHILSPNTTFPKNPREQKVQLACSQGRASSPFKPPPPRGVNQKHIFRSPHNCGWTWLKHTNSFTTFIISLILIHKRKRRILFFHMFKIWNSLIKAWRKVQYYVRSPQICVIWYDEFIICIWYNQVQPNWDMQL